MKNKSMSLKLKSFFDEYWKQLSIITLIIVIVFNQIIFFGKSYLIGIDQNLFYNPLYQEWIRLIHNFIKTGEFPFYSWYKLFGSDFYSSASYFVTSDPFIPLFLFIKDLKTALFIETILLIYISSITFRVFLKSMGFKKPLSLLTLSISYAFTGMAVMYFSNYMWHRFIAFMPLLFYGVERIINDKKVFPMILSTSLLFFLSVYFMFPTSIFLVFYSIFSYTYKQNKLFQVVTLKVIFMLITAYILGFLLSAFFTLPSILQLIDNPRIGSTLDTEIFWNIKVYLALFFSHISAPFAIFTNIPYIFFWGDNAHSVQFSAYTFALMLPILIYYFMFTKDKNRNYFLFLHLVLLIIMIIKPLSSIMHGFSEASFRYIFLYSFTILITLAYYFENYEETIFIKSWFVYLAFVILAILASILYGIIDWSIYKLNILFILATILYTSIVIYLVRDQKKLFIFILFEITVSSTLIILSYTQLFYSFQPSLTPEYVDYYQSIDDDSFYRMYINPTHLLPTSTMNLNQSLITPYHSVMSYDTGFDPNLTRFLQSQGVTGNQINIDDPEVLRMLGVKYFIVYDESELPKGYTFEYQYDLDFLKVYKLMTYRSIGFTYTDFETINQLSDKWQFWNDVALVEDKDLHYVYDIQPSASQNIQITNRTTNTLSFNINLTSKQLVFLSIPYNKGWRIFDEEWNIINPLRINGGFIGLVLEKGDHSIYMRFVPYGLKEGVYLSIFGALITSLIFLLEKFKNRSKI